MDESVGANFATYLSLIIAVIDAGISLLIFLGLASFLRRVFPSNSKDLEVKLLKGEGLKIGSQAFHSAEFELKNSGDKNIYISRAYFKEGYKTFWVFNRKSAINIFQFADRLHAKGNSFELKFLSNSLGDLTDREAIIRPKARVSTLLPLSSEIDENTLLAKKSGYLYLEYASEGQRGVHKVLL
ncbi:TPA: hypothetical protein ACPJ1Q_000869 [Vibrio alginolyticus]